MTDENTTPQGENDAGADDRREFLKNAGKFAAIVPPAMAFLLTTTMSSSAIAVSGGGGGSTGGDNCHQNPRGQWVPPGCND